MSPLLHSYRQRRPHDFGFVLPLAHGQRTLIFTPTNLPDQVAGMHCDPDGLQTRDGSLVVVDVAIDRSDVAVDLHVGLKNSATICGPWMRGQIVDYSLILKDMMENRREDEAKSLLKELQQLRDIDIDSVCKPCGGYGTRLYSNTSTWHGGMGGASMTNGVCDQCWGSGDRERQWTNLRTIADRTRDQVAERALTALADSCGASYDSSFDSIRQIIEHLDAFTRKRKVDGIWTAPLANGLANILRRAIGLPEKEMR